MIQDAEDVIGVHVCPPLYATLAKEYSNLVSVKVEGVRTAEKIVEVKSLLGDELVIFGGMAARIMLKELRLGAQGNIPDSCLTDLLVQVYENYVRGNLNKAEEVFQRYRMWVDFLSLHSVSSSEIEKETLRLRGVVKSSFTRHPKVPLDESDCIGLKNVLKKMEIIS
jgi:4-hydroxy-tetrahydrodipicolinate synthase